MTSSQMPQQADEPPAATQSRAMAALPQHLRARSARIDQLLDQLATETSALVAESWGPDVWLEPDPLPDGTTEAWRLRLYAIQSALLDVCEPRRHLEPLQIQVVEQRRSQPRGIS